MLNNPIRITFDSNIIDWVLGVKMPSETYTECCSKVVAEIKSGRILPCVPIEYFILEQWRRVDRDKEMMTPPEMVSLCRSKGGSRFKERMLFNRQIKLNDYSLKTLKALRDVNGKILPTLRFGLPVADEIKPNSDLFDCRKVGISYRDREQVFIDVLDYIEEIGCGDRLVHDRCNSSAPECGPYYLISNSGLAEEKKGRLYAELADCDMIAAHLAHRNDFLCTLDKGAAFGAGAVLRPRNVLKLQKKFGLEVVTLPQLAAVLC